MPLMDGRVFGNHSTKQVFPSHSWIWCNVLVSTCLTGHRFPKWASWTCQLSTGGSSILYFSVWTSLKWENVRDDFFRDDGFYFGWVVAQLWLQLHRSENSNTDDCASDGAAKMQSHPVRFNEGSRLWPQRCWLKQAVLKFVYVWTQVISATTCQHPVPFNTVILTLISQHKLYV